MHPPQWAPHHCRAVPAAHALSEAQLAPVARAPREQRPAIGPPRGSLLFAQVRGQLPEAEEIAVA